MTDYLQWQSDLSLEEVFAGSELFSYPTPLSAEQTSKSFIYLTQLKEENSRSVLMNCVLGNDGLYKRQCITPKPFNCRTNVNEYGGKPFWVFDKHIVFVNQADQCLYRQTIKSNEITQPECISCLAGDQQYMYTDIHQLDQDNYLAIVESGNLLENHIENQSFLGLINSQKNDVPPVALVSGADFYCNLVVSHQRNLVAWVEWQHPTMPWDDNQLMIAEIVGAASQPSIDKSQPIDLGAPASVCQLLFADNDSLYFSADFSASHASSLSVSGAKLSSSKVSNSANYWNIYCYEPSRKELQQVTQLQAEFGYPHWQYGDHRICQKDADSLLAVASYPEYDALYQIKLSNHSTTKLTELVGLQSLASNYSLTNGSLTNKAAKAYSVLAVQQYNNRHSSIVEHRDDTLESIEITSARSQQYTGQISDAQHITFSTRDQQLAHGFYYAPANEHYQNDTPPPLLVMVHGGPTARAYGHFDLQKQFWTSRGFAIFDVNHRGSSGYGRRFRDGLYGQWGIVDTNDIVDGVQALIDQGLAAPKQICIRGKSAGGYAVLRALTEYPKLFCAGACYYGIGNLITLADTTHKFEKYYTDRLIGESYNAASAQKKESAYYQRSPINKVDKIASAMIIFQGMQDNIVPPEVAKEMVAALKIANLEHVYIEYQDEGHGFRQVNNNVDAWSRELAFYQHVFAKVIKQKSD